MRSGPRRTWRQFRIGPRKLGALRRAALVFARILEVADARRGDRPGPLTAILHDRELRKLYLAAKVIGRHSAPGQRLLVTR